MQLCYHSSSSSSHFSLPLYFLHIYPPSTSILALQARKSDLPLTVIFHLIPGTLLIVNNIILFSFPLDFCLGTPTSFPPLPTFPCTCPTILYFYISLRYLLESDFNELKHVCKQKINEAIHDSNIDKSPNLLSIIYKC